MTTTPLYVVEQIRERVMAEPRPPRSPGRFQMPLPSTPQVAEPAQPANDNQPWQPKPRRARFDVTWFEHIDEQEPKEHVIEGVFGVSEFSAVVAKPGMAKSVLLADMCCHAAAGMNWHGRDVKCGLVVFFAAERKKLTERRVAAFGKRYGLKKIPLTIVGGRLDLTTGLADARALIETVRELEQQCGMKCIWIVVDTLTRTFGPGDQHASRDMGRYIQSVDEIIRSTGAHVTAIHHSPWNEDRGKGAIDLDGAIDASFLIKKSGKTFNFICDGSNDGEEGPITAFKLESVELGMDKKGNPITAPIVVQVQSKLAGLYEDAPPRKEPSGLSATALKSLRSSIDDAGETPPEDNVGFPEGVRVLSREAWQKQFVADSDAKPETAARSFRRVADTLIADRFVGQLGQWVWLIADIRT